MNRIPPFLKWLASSLLAIGLLTGVFLLKGEGQPTPLPTQVTATPSQGTEIPVAEVNNLLVALIDSNQQVVSATILQKAPDNSTLHVINVDPDTEISVAGQPPVKLADAGLGGSFDGIDKAIAVAIGTPVDGSVYLQRLALAGLVDSVGGISVTSDGIYRVSVPGEPDAYVYKGTTNLDGKQAAGFAMVRGRTETAESFTNRTNQVLRATFEKMPSDQQRVEEVLSALGSLARSNVPTASVAKLVVSLRDNNLWPIASYARALIM